MDTRSNAVGRSLAFTVVLAILSFACAPAVRQAGPDPRRPAVDAPEEIPRSGVFPTSVEHFDGVIASGDVPTVVNVWASWCIPCRAETPLLVEAARRYEGEVRFLGLNTQDAEEEAVEFIHEFDVPYPSGLDPTGRVARHLKALGLPVTLFFARGGELVFVHNGEIRAPDLDEKITELLRVSRSRVG